MCTICGFNCSRCDHYNVHLIADEIATGYGRTGKMFACNHADISPDIMCLSKGLTGGYMPMGLTVTTKKVFDAFYADYSEGKAFMHSHTYSGNPLACAAAIEVLRIMEDEQILAKVNENAVFFNNLVCQKLQGHEYVGEIRSIGLINAIELVEDQQTKRPFDSKLRLGYEIYRKALEKGVLLRPLGDVLYFNPLMIISKDDMEYVTQACVESIQEVI